MNSVEKAAQIVEHMMANDAFSQWLGIEIIKIDVGSVELCMKVNTEMTNGFLMAHGGITYSLADSALAFAANTHGKKAMSIDTQISHLKACRARDELRAIATELSRSRKLGRYQVEIFNQQNDLVAHFWGTVFIKLEDWEI